MYLVHVLYPVRRQWSAIYSPCFTLTAGNILTVGHSNKIAADIETNEAFPDRKTNPTDSDKLERCNPKRLRICSPK